VFFCGAMDESKATKGERFFKRLPVEFRQRIWGKCDEMVELGIWCKISSSGSTSS